MTGGPQYKEEYKPSEDKSKITPYSSENMKPCDNHKTKLTDVLSVADSLIHGEKNEDYGDPYDDYLLTTKLFKEMTGIDMSPPQGILFMVCVKLSRESRKHKKDNLIDSCGYLGLYEYALKRLESIHNANKRGGK